MFAGYQSATRPFSGTIDALIAGGEASYAGDDGPRRLQVSATRFIEVADPGSDVFMGIDNGAGGSQSIFKTIADLVGAMSLPRWATSIAGLTMFCACAARSVRA